MTATPVQALIQALVACHRDGSQLRAADWQHAVRDEADAYDVQDGVAAALGWPLTHWKSGGAGPLGPFSHAPVDPTAAKTLLGIEAEVALRVDAHGAPEAMCIAVELVASRWVEGLAAPALLRMADGQSNAGLLLGPWQPYRALDWANVSWRLALPGDDVITRRGGHSLADPAGVLPAWARHATRAGRPIPAGSVVTTGAWGGLHTLAGPAHGSLSFDGLGEFRF